MSFHNMMKRIEKRIKKSQVYVSLPLLLKDYNYREVIKEASKSFVKKYPEYRRSYFFNPFDEINQSPPENLYKVDVNYEDLTQEEINFYRKKIKSITQEKIMEECLEEVRNSKALLSILPKPVEIDYSLTLGAVSECDEALKNRENVYICLYDLKDSEVSSIFKIPSLDELFEKFQEKVPGWWIDKRELDISDEFIEN